MRMIMAAALAVAALTAGCSDSGPDQATPTGSATVTPRAVSTPEPVTTPLPKEAEITLDGKAYPARFYQCAQRLWDSRVGQWNALSQADRDKVAGGSDAWMKSRGWPVTFQATLASTATRKVCPA